MNQIPLTPSQSEALRIHTDPRWGSAYWIERAGRFGMTDIDRVSRVEDLSSLGTMTPQDLRARPLWDYIPRRYHAEPKRFVLGQTGGTSGPPTWTAYLEEEFHAAFVQPFVDAAAHVGFPRGGTWLYVGPSGPHIIGQAARAIARAVGSVEPFSVDFDPRWARKLTAGTVAATRYLQHVVDQAMQVIGTQPIDTLFATPPVLLALTERMTIEQRSSIRAVHYGGMALTEGDLSRLQDSAFPEAVHLSGYGNTLMGCCLELSCEPGRELDYYPHGDRLLLHTVDDGGNPASFGRVVASRFDQSFLIINMVERDHATMVYPHQGMPAAFHSPGLRNPHTPTPAQADTAPVGLY